MNAFHVNIWIESEAAQLGASFTDATRCLARSTPHVGIFIERVVPSSLSYIDPCRSPSCLLRHRRRSKSTCTRAPLSRSSASRGTLGLGLGDSLANASANANTFNRNRAVSIGGPEPPPSPSPRPLQLPLQLLRRSRERSRLTLHAFVRALASRVARLSGFRLHSLSIALQVASHSLLLAFSSIILSKYSPNLNQTWMNTKCSERFPSRALCNHKYIVLCSSHVSLLMTSICEQSGESVCLVLQKQYAALWSLCSPAPTATCPGDEGARALRVVRRPPRRLSGRAIGTARQVLLLRTRRRLRGPARARVAPPRLPPYRTCSRNRSRPAHWPTAAAARTGRRSSRPSSTQSTSRTRAGAQVAHVTQAKARGGQRWREWFTRCSTRTAAASGSSSSSSRATCSLSSASTWCSRRCAGARLCYALCCAWAQLLPDERIIVECTKYSTLSAPEIRVFVCDCVATSVRSSTCPRRSRTRVPSESCCTDTATAISSPSPLASHLLISCALLDMRIEWECLLELSPLRIRINSYLIICMHHSMYSLWICAACSRSRFPARSSFRSCPVFSFLFQKLSSSSALYVLCKLYSKCHSVKYLY